MRAKCSEHFDYEVEIFEKSSKCNRIIYTYWGARCSRAQTDLFEGLLKSGPGFITRRGVYIYIEHRCCKKPIKCSGELYIHESS